MKKEKSFSHIEQELCHAYRNNLNIAESDVDVKKFFAYAVKDLLEKACGGQVTVEYDDVCLELDGSKGFVCSKTLQKNKVFMQVWNYSDLPRIVERLAEKGLNRIKHLMERHPDKTEAKIYPTPSHSGQRFSNQPPKRK